MAGEYKAWLEGTPHAHVRLALTNRPSIVMIRCENLIPTIIEIVEGVEDPLAKQKIADLRSGACVPVIYPKTVGPEKVWAPGELFLRS